MDTDLLLDLHNLVLLAAACLGATLAYRHHREMQGCEHRTTLPLATGEAVIGGPMVVFNHPLPVKVEITQTCSPAQSSDWWEVSRGRAFQPFGVRVGAEVVRVEPSEDADVVTALAPHTQLSAVHRTLIADLGEGSPVAVRGVLECHVDSGQQKPNPFSAPTSEEALGRGLAPASRWVLRPGSAKMFISTLGAGRLDREKRNRWAGLAVASLTGWLTTQALLFASSYSSVRANHECVVAEVTGSRSWQVEAREPFRRHSLFRSARPPRMETRRATQLRVVESCTGAATATAGFEFEEIGSTVFALGFRQRYLIDPGNPHRRRAGDTLELGVGEYLVGLGIMALEVLFLWIWFFDRPWFQRRIRRSFFGRGSDRFAHSRFALPEEIATPEVEQTLAEPKSEARAKQPHRKRRRAGKS